MNRMKPRRPCIVYVSTTVVLFFAITAYAQEFTLTTSQSNIISSKASIARPGLDGNPQAIIVATPLGDAAMNNPHPIGAWYYKDKWNIFNTDHAVMPVNMRYKIEYWLKPDANHFLHIFTTQNIGDDGSYLDHPLLNGHPNAVVKILQNYAPDDRAGYSLNSSEAKASYNTAAGKWYIANVNGNRLYPNSAYSVAIFSDGTESTTMTAQTTAVSTPLPVKRPEISLTPLNQSTVMASPPDGGSGCTKEMAWQTVGKWTKQGRDDLAMADGSFPKDQYKAVLAKAQKAIELFKQASPELKGIESSPYRGIRGEPHIAGGPVPFRAEIVYKSYFCVGNDTASVDKRGKIILFGNYGTTVVQFNSLRDVLDTVIENGGFSTVNGDEIYEYKKDLGEFKGFTMVEPFIRDEEHHEAVIIASGRRLPYKLVTREQFLFARIKFDQSRGITGDIAGLNSALARMSATERQTPAIVRDTNASPGRSKLFATEAEGGRHLVTVDKSYFDSRLSRDAVQLITVHWYWNDSERPKAEAVRAMKEKFDFEALRQMLGK